MDTKERRKEIIKNLRSKIINEVKEMKEQEPSKLDQRQLKAVELLLIGYSDEKVAREIGVRRETVCRWRNNNYYFKAELNKGRKDQWESARTKLRSLAHDAIDTVAKAVKNGDVKASLEVLKCLNLYGNIESPDEPTDTRTLIYEEAKMLTERTLESQHPLMKDYGRFELMECYVEYFKKLNDEADRTDEDTAQITDDHCNAQAE